MPSKRWGSGEQVFDVTIRYGDCIGQGDNEHFRWTASVAGEWSYQRRLGFMQPCGCTTIQRLPRRSIGADDQVACLPRRRCDAQPVGHTRQASAATAYRRGVGGRRGEGQRRPRARVRVAAFVRYRCWRSLPVPNLVCAVPAVIPTAAPICGQEHPAVRAWATASVSGS